MRPSLPSVWPLTWTPSVCPGLASSSRDSGVRPRAGAARGLVSGALGLQSVQFIILLLGDEQQLQVILKEVWMNVVEPDTCQELLRKTKLGRFFQLDRDSFLCAGGEVDVDMCTVGSGSYYCSQSLPTAG